MTNTHILVNEFTYLRPTSLAEAGALLAEYGPEAQLLAGGTNLLVWMKMERRMPRYIVDIGRLPHLAQVSAADGLTLGPLVTIRALRDAPAVRARYTALADAGAAFGSVQVQMMGTLGGNICNGSPASDTVPVLLAFDAQVTLTAPSGTRTLPLAEILAGPGRVALRTGEILTAVHLPPLPSRTGSAFLKISRVAADLAKASVAAVLVGDGEVIADCRLAYGSVGPTALRARRAEQVLIGRRFDPQLALEAGRIAAEEVAPIDDLRSTARYRRQVVRALTYDALLAAHERLSAPATARPSHQAGVVRPRPAPPAHPRRVEPHEEREITLTVNGVRRSLRVRPNALLLNVLRERLGLTGAKYGCGIGECGACTVILNGRPVLACLVLAVAADGAEILTVEGLESPDGTLHPLQTAFIEHNAFQCGYCTPGMLMMTHSLLAEIPHPTEEEVRDYLKGNRCRCTGYTAIVRAVLAAAGQSEE